MKETRRDLKPQPGQRAALLGFGLSNRHLANFLARNDVQVFAYDQNDQIYNQEHWQDIAPSIKKSSFGKDYLLKFSSDLQAGFDWVFVTPGMKKDIPQLQQAREHKAIISSELALFMSLSCAKMIGITGSSGKTTTVSMIHQFMKKAGFDVWLGGNIGRPLISQLENIKSKDWVVLEISSFQLELARNVPQISAILNISPNHLDIHGTMQDYIDAKAKIIRNQGRDEYALLNADCIVTRQIADDAGGNVYYYSTENRGGDDLENSFAGEFDGRDIWLNCPERRKLCSKADVPLRGTHNISNTLAASIIARHVGVSIKDIRNAISTFDPVEHRLEEVSEINQVLYVNDSIATSPDRTIAALESYSRNIILILGGYNKGLSFDELSRQINEEVACGDIKYVVLTGESAQEIEKSLSKYMSDDNFSKKVLLSDDFDHAFSLAKKNAGVGDVILMSPACASFDAFGNYIERGKRFRELVEKVKT